MRRSIKYKIMFMVLAIIAFLLVTISLVNNLALETYYVNEKVKAIQNAYQRIDTEVMTALENGETIIPSTLTQEEEDTKNSTEASQNLQAILAEYSNKYNITIALIDSLTDKALYSSERDGDLLSQRVKDGIFGNRMGKSVTTLYTSANYSIISHYVTKSNSSYIECIGYCSDNTTMVIMSTPVASLKESVSLSNTFILYLAGLSFFLAIILTFCVAGMITRPIQQLTDISKKMGKLDFTAKYMGKRVDEIGVLGTNMNAMSVKLEETIEELKHANAVLQEDIKRKEEIDEMRKDFIANVSHELKTPIALIQGYAEGLNEGLCEDEESRKYYTDVIMDEAEKMNVMVKQLLALSALESGGQELHITTFDIVDLIKGVLDATSILIKEKNIEIEFDDSGALSVAADEFKLEEVLTNYVSNAIHHVSENGKIRILAKRVEEERVRVSVYNTGNHIPNEDLSQLWEKFYKVDKAHSRSYGGSGIGLSIVKAIIETHGGIYGVENVEDGVEFWFVI